MRDITLILLAKNNDKNSKQILIEKYLPLVKKEIKKYPFIDNYDYDDLIQYGILSILKAIKAFDVEKKTQFPSYVKFAVINNFAYLCRQNPSEKCATSLNIENEDGLEIIDLIEDNKSTEDIFINNYEDNRILKARELLSTEERQLFDFLMYSGVRCPLKRYSEKYNIDYSKCIYQKKKLCTKLKKIFLNIY